MVTDQQVRRLRRLDLQGLPKERAADKAGLDAKTAQVSPARQTAQRGATHGPRLPHAPRPVRRGLAPARRVAPPQPRTGGQDLVRRPATPFSWPLRRRPTAHLPTPRQAVACAARLCQRGVLQPGSPSRSAVRQRFHALHRLACHPQRRAFRPHDLPLRADLLELGGGDDLLRRELRELERGLAECLGCVGRSATVAPHRPADGGDSARDGRLGLLHGSLPGAAAALWFAGAGDPGGPGPRERRCRAESSAVQACVGAGAAAAWQPRLRQSPGLCGVPESLIRPAQCRASAASGGGDAVAASAAGAAAGSVPAALGACGPRQHDPRAAATPTRWRAG